MEDIGKIMRRAVEPPTLSSPPAGSKDWICPRCGTAFNGLIHPISERVTPAWFVYGEIAPSGARVCAACATQERREIVARQILEDKLLSFGLSAESYQNMSFAAYKPVTTEQTLALAAAQALVKRWTERGLQPPASSLVLWSPMKSQNPQRQGFGIGKTHLAIAMLAEAAKLGYSVAIAKMPDLIEAIRATYNEDSRQGENAVLDEIRQAQVALLDDVGTEYVKEGSERWYQDIVYRLIDNAYGLGHALLITTNLEPKDLLARIGGRAASRLAGLCAAPVFLVGPDHRSKPF